MKRITYASDSNEPSKAVFYLTISAESPSPGDYQRIDYEIKTTLPPYGKYVFDVRKMLSGIDFFKVSDFIGQEPVEMPVINLRITEQNSEAFTNYFLLSSNIQDGDEDKFKRAWLTVKPQVSWTTENSPLPLIAILDDVRDDGKKYCYLTRVYFKSEPPRLLCLGKLRPSLYCGEYIRQYIDCSYSKIKALAEEEGLTDRITAYDIYPVKENDYGEWSQNSSPLILPQRFILRKEQGYWKSFVFANSIGGVDTVVSTGRCKTLMSGDTSALVNDGVEMEVSNDAMEQVEINSGYIDSDSHRKLWYEFLKSTDRCVAQPDGTLRNIIVDEYKCEYTLGELSSFTFKYHLAEPQYVRPEERTDLDEYYIGE